MDKIVPYLHHVPDARLLSAQVNVTNRCFNRCIMCKKWVDWPKTDELTTDDLISILRDCNDMNVKSVIFSGGEPFARKDLIKVTAYKGDVKVGVLTSGIWDDTYTVGSVVNSFDLIHFSLDTIDSKTYQSIRGVSQCTNVMTRLLDVQRLIKSEKLLPTQLKVNIVMQRLNQHNITDTIEFCTAHDIDYRVSLVHTFDDLRTSKSEYVVPQRCIVPYFHCIIDADGLVFSCCHVLNDNDFYCESDRSWAFGNVREKGLYEVWNSERAEHTRRMLFDTRVAECKRCDNRYIHLNENYRDFAQRLKEPIFL